MTGREQKLFKENEELRLRLNEAEHALNAFTKGVDPNEETVRVSERKIRGILDATRESIWMFSTEGIILLANPTACERIGKSEQEIVGRHFREIIPAEIARSRMERLQEVVKTAAPLEFEDERAGRFFRHSFYPVMDEKGDVTSVVSFSRDITDSKNAEDALLNKEKLLKSVLDNVSSGVAMIDDTGKFSVFNPLFLKLFGLTVDSSIKNVNDQNWALWQVFNEDGTLLDVDEHPVRKAALTGKLVEHQLVGVRLPSGGEITWMLITAEPIYKEDGSIDKIICTYHDITEQKKNERNLQQLIRTLSAMQKSSLMMTRATNEKQFLRDVCRIIIEDCGHKMVWIGYKKDNPGKTVKSVAYAGFEDDYLKTLKITWGESERGRGPTGTAIRTGKPALCRNMHTDPLFKPWRIEALKRGYSSSIALPLKMDDMVFGAVTIYSREPDPFSPDEQLLLTQLADDLAYGIKAIRLNIALKQSKANLEVKVKERTALLRKAMEDLDAERRRFLEVLNMLPVYVALIAPDFSIRYANKVFKENFGEPEEKKCHALLFGKKEMCDECHLSKVPKTEKSNSWEGVGINGRVFQVSEFSFTDFDGVPVILEMGLDITEKKGIEKFVMSKIIETEERDRKRFAGDLHDDLGPTLSAVKLQLNLVNALNSEKERKELLNAIDQLLSESVDKMRNIANTIMPRLISNFGLEKALNSFINNLEKSSGISFRMNSNLNGYRFNEEMELHLYRIMTELVNNTIKHAGASGVSIDMQLTEKELRVVYSDNGKGYNVDKISAQVSGIGLQNIRNRINLIGGTISFKSADQKTVVTISVPINKKD